MLKTTKNDKKTLNTRKQCIQKNSEKINKIIMMKCDETMCIKVQINHEKINYTVTAQLDTGAECNLISKNWLKKYPQLLKKIKPCTINLQGPTNQPIQCEGCIALNISCGGQVKKIDFVVTQQDSIVLLGLPALRRFKLCMNIPKNTCYFDTNNAKHAINNVHQNKTWLKLTPCQKYSFTGTPIVVVLQICAQNNGLHYMYRRVRLYNCTCYLELKTLCHECKNHAAGEYVIKPRYKKATISIRYASETHTVIQPGKDFWQAELIPAVNYMTARPDETMMRYEMLEPPAWSWEENGIKFDKNGFGQPKILNPEIDKQLKFDKINWENTYVCNECEKKNEAFCNFSNKTCQSLEELKSLLDKRDAKCKVIEIKGVQNINQHHICFINMIDSSRVDNMKKLKPEWGPYLGIVPKNSEQIIIYNMHSINVFHMLLTMLTPSFVEMNENLSKIALFCKRKKIKKTGSSRL